MAEPVRILYCHCIPGVSPSVKSIITFKSRAVQVLSKVYKTMDLTRWREIIKKSHPGALLMGSTDLYVRGVLKNVPRFAKLASKPETRFMVAEVRAGRRKVKGICAYTHGKTILISMSALEGKKVTNRQKALACMRELIKEQIENYRLSRKITLHSEYTCPLSGKDLRKCAKTHVDHFSVSFSKLVQEWCKLEKVDLNAVEIQGRPGRLCFGQPHLNQSWRRFHATHADLQLVDATANLKKGKKTLVEYKMSL